MRLFQEPDPALLSSFLQQIHEEEVTLRAKKSNFYNFDFENDEPLAISPLAASPLSLSVSISSRPAAGLSRARRFLWEELKRQLQEGNRNMKTAPIKQKAETEADCKISSEGAAESADVTSTSSGDVAVIEEEKTRKYSVLEDGAEEQKVGKKKRISKKSNESGQECCKRHKED